MRSTIQRITRRRFLKAGAAGAISLVGGAVARSARGASAPASRTTGARCRIRPDLLDKTTPAGVEVIQITTDPELGGSHIYMEAQIFTADSRHFVLQCSGHAHGSDRKDPRHRFLRCDIDDGFSLHPLTDEPGAVGPSVSPDGKHLYYFVEETKRQGGRIHLKRVGLDGTGRETLIVLDAPLPGTPFRPRRLYPLSTISSDGRRLATSAFLGDGKINPPPFGLLVFDLDRPAVRLVIHGDTWSNMHPQFCRARDAGLARDILIQENHGSQTDANGERQKKVGGDGADIHVIRDDGTNLRDMPWGRDGHEFCQGHQCWRGRTGWAITSTVVPQAATAELIESLPVPHVGHVGLKAPGGVRNKISRGFPNPRFYHFATDAEGTRLVSDHDPFGPEARICTARLGKPGVDALSEFVCLARPRPSGRKTAHMHPFLSPDGRMAFFNSDESGTLQAYAVRGFVA